MSSMNDQATRQDVASDELRGLLCSYHEVLMRSRRLPAVVWMSTRAAGAAPTAGWLRLPRLSWGTHLFVLFHIERSVRSLARLYAVRAALGRLDEQGRADRTAVDDFLLSLRPVRWRWFVLAAAAATLIVGRAIVETVAQELQTLTFGVSGPFDETQIRALRETLDEAITTVSTLSPDGVAGMTSQLGAASVETLAALALGLLVAAYAVLRPATTAFRLKRVLFNMADEPEWMVRRTASTWHVSRSVGLYEREQRVLAAAGVDRVPRERPVDLLLSTIITLILGWEFLAIYPVTGPAADWVFGVLLVLPLLGLRLAWLSATHRSRARPAQPWGVPTSGLLPASGRTVDVRRATEAAAMAPWFAPVLTYRLARQLDDVRVESGRQSGRQPGRAPRILLVLLAAASWIGLSPVLLSVAAWRSRRHAAAGTRAWPPVVATVASVLAFALWLPILLVVPTDDPYFTALGMTYSWLVATAFGLTQVWHADLVRTYADPLRYDVAPTQDELPAPRFTTPDGWPEPPPDWTPQPGWTADRDWPRVKPGWRTWSRGPAQLATPARHDN